MAAKKAIGGKRGIKKAKRSAKGRGTKKRG